MDPKSVHQLNQVFLAVLLPPCLFVAVLRFSRRKDTKFLLHPQLLSLCVTASSDRPACCKAPCQICLHNFWHRGALAAYQIPRLLSFVICSGF